MAVGRSLVVFDFGSGTLDVAAVRREPAELRVLGTGGLDNLGGLDVDAALVGHLGQAVDARDPALWARLSNPADPAALRDRRAFWARPRSAKEMLSRTVAAPVPLPGDAGALHLTRDELQRVAGPLVDRAVDETRRLLRDARIGPDELAGIFLVGGSSRMPLVATKLHERLGVAPAVPEQPELPVSFGALAAAADGPPRPAPPAADGPPRPAPPAADGPPRPAPPGGDGPPRPAPPGGDGWAPRSADWPGATANGGAVEAGARRTPAGRSNRVRILAGVLAAVALLGGGLIWWYVAQRPAGGGNTGAARDSPGATQGGPGTNRSAPGPSTPTGSVPCGQGKLCPTTPICWGGPVIIAGNATAEQRDCGESHCSETYIAAYLPPDAVGVSYSKLQQRPDIKALCDVSVLVSRLRTPTGNGGWVWEAMPVAAGADKVVHCMGGRNQKNPLTVSLFRTGP
ncbi:Hsp70 family protein [Dactylosporangium sp. McL0621]|uniref:Hsp70 family protein n=1 Tax=Dactylosporangium sp. McL0621 TaxID=3415678 RepID=UPI003CE9D178